MGTSLTQTFILYITWKELPYIEGRSCFSTGYAKMPPTQVCETVHDSAFQLYGLDYGLMWWDHSCTHECAFPKLMCLLWCNYIEKINRTINFYFACLEQACVYWIWQECSSCKWEGQYFENICICIIVLYWKCLFIYILFIFIYVSVNSL